MWPDNFPHAQVLLLEYFQNVKGLDTTKNPHLQTSSLILSVTKGQDKLSFRSLPRFTSSALTPSSAVRVSNPFVHVPGGPATLPAPAPCQLLPRNPDCVCQIATPYTNTPTGSVQTLHYQWIYTAAFRQNPERIQTSFVHELPELSAEFHIMLTILLVKMKFPWIFLLVASM